MTRLDEIEAIEAVATAARRLFSVMTERQARDLAAAVLRDLRREGLHLVRDAECPPPPRSSPGSAARRPRQPG